MPRKKEQKLYTPASAAEHITNLDPTKPISAHGIRKAIQRGKLRAKPVGKATGPQWIITEDDLNDWNEHNRNPQGRPPKQV